MPLSVLLALVAIGSFVFGGLFGAVSAIALFKGSIMQIQTQIGHIETAAGKLDGAMELLRGEVRAWLTERRGGVRHEPQDSHPRGSV